MYKMENILNALKENAKPEKAEWTRKILTTKMPLLSVQMADLKKIIKEIKKEDYIDYLESETFKYYENTIIYAKILSKLESFDDFKKYLLKLLPYVDNWSTCDAIEVNFDKSEFENIFNLSKKLIKDAHEFTRRIGVRLLFKMLNYQEYTAKALAIVKELENEKEYYVNMCIGWFLCEAFIKQRDYAILFIKEFENETAVRKTISKCRDSFRVSNEDKAFLKTLL